VAQLRHQALGSLFVASYDSQGYGGVIRPRLHTDSNMPQYVPLPFKTTNLKIFLPTFLNALVSQFPIVLQWWSLLSQSDMSLCFNLKPLSNLQLHFRSRLSSFYLYHKRSLLVGYHELDCTLNKFIFLSDVYLLET
jgi:hypothetical protein